MTKIKILLVEDLKMFSDLLIENISKEADLKIVSSVDDGLEALQVLENITIDVVVTDIRLRQMHGDVLTVEIKKRFPEIKVFNIDLNFLPKLAANFNAFVEPTILVFFQGKEYIRKSRNIGIFELEQTIERPYKLIF